MAMHTRHVNARPDSISLNLLRCANFAKRTKKSVPVCVDWLAKFVIGVRRYDVHLQLDKIHDLKRNLEINSSWFDAHLFVKQNKKIVVFVIVFRQKWFFFKQ